MNPMIAHGPQGDIIADPSALDAALRFVDLICQSSLVPAHLRGNKADILLAFYLARTINENPLLVLQSIHIIQGRASWSAQYLIAKANSCGRFRGGIRWRLEGTGDELAVTAHATLAETGEEVSHTVTMAMAHAEGWTKRNPKYRTMPDLMLKYRSATLLVRLFCPDVLLGLHEQNELIDIGSKAEPARPAPLVVVEAEPEPLPALPPPAVPQLTMAPAPEPSQEAAPSDATPEGAPKRVWSESEAAEWRASVQALGLDYKIAADTIEEAGRPRPSEMKGAHRKAALHWLKSEEAQDLYSRVQEERLGLLAEARELSVAVRREAAARAGTGTEPAKLHLSQLRALLAAAVSVAPDGSAP